MKKKSQNSKMLFAEHKGRRGEGVENHLKFASFHNVYISHGLIENSVSPFLGFRDLSRTVTSTGDLKVNTLQLLGQGTKGTKIK